MAIIWRSDVISATIYGRGRSLSYNGVVTFRPSPLRSRVKINIIKQPAGVVGGFSLDHYRPGRVYDVSAHLANYLVAEGFAIFDRRDEFDEGTASAPDRRKTTSNGL